MNNVGSNGNHWSSSPNSATNGYNLNFNSGNVNPSNNNNRANGFPVRCVKHLPESLQIREVFFSVHMTITSDALMADIIAAYHDARTNKRGTSSQLSFEIRLEDNLVELHQAILERTYLPSPCMCFMTRDPVLREIFASPFRDRVVHHLLFNYLEPMLEPLFIYDSYSCRIGKGTLGGIRRCEHHIRSCSMNWKRPAYVLQLDVRGYFMNIKKEILYRTLCEDIQSRKNAISPLSHRPWKDSVDYELVDFLIRSILFRDPTRDCLVIGDSSEWKDLPAEKSLFNTPADTGLPIGDLTSQLFSNVYLNQLDQYVKRELRCGHYGRYVDDFYIVHWDRDYLFGLIGKIATFLEKNLAITLHPKKVRISSADMGIKFLGAVIKPYSTCVSSRTIKSFHRKMTAWEQRCSGNLPVHEIDRLVQVVNSYLGHLHHFDTYQIRQKQFASSPLKKYLQFSGGWRKCETRNRSRRVIPLMEDKALFNR